MRPGLTAQISSNTGVSPTFASYALGQTRMSRRPDSGPAAGLRNLVMSLSTSGCTLPLPSLFLIVPKSKSPSTATMITAQDYLVVAAAAGGALAQRFRRHEPSISSALWITAGTRLMLAVCPYYGATFVVELQASLVMVTSLYIYIALYRLLFHPLNRFPGPRIAAVSQLYTFRHRLLRQEVFVNETLHERYGDVVRIGLYHSRFTPHSLRS